MNTGRHLLAGSPLDEATSGGPDGDNEVGIVAGCFNDDGLFSNERVTSTSRSVKSPGIISHHFDKNIIIMYF